jgi:crotonobetainyl-CoA:carnitine CoA-transferase CaiB-like acyl-CoA transferase
MEMTMTSEPTGPLAGVTVLEVAQVVAGPTCGYMLADLGADVIKVERVPGGDDTRRMTPPEIDGESAAFMMLNRNKRGIALDLKSDGGRGVLMRLACTADVIIENFRKGAMDRLGFGYDALAADNPGLIYAAISGFGRSGPYATRGGYDLIAQGMSGLMSITGEGSGRSPTTTPGCWPRSASSRPMSTGSRPAAASSSTPRCLRPR